MKTNEHRQCKETNGNKMCVFFHANKGENLCAYDTQDKYNPNYLPIENPCITPSFCPFGEHITHEEQKNDYLQKNGNYCLYCDSDDITAGMPGINEDGTIQINVCCLSCGEEWIDVYKLTEVITE